jgi:AraC-like DNA-binding protein
MTMAATAPRSPASPPSRGSSAPYDSPTVSYREHAHLGPHIACIWTRDPTPAPATHRIVPDACVDVVWTRERLVVAGPATGPVITRTEAHSPTHGVRFRIGAAGAALGLPAAELLDQTVPLADVWPDTGRLENAAAQGPAALAAALTARIEHEPDRAVRAAAAGMSVSLGDRQLRRRFADAVGYGPKTLDRILRFQRFLVLARATTWNLAALALEAGYADQAHLTRECTRLSGLPPAALLASGAGPAGERSDSFKTAGALPATMAA